LAFIASAFFLQLLGITSMTILIVFPLINLLLPGIEH